MKNDRTFTASERQFSNQKTPIKQPQSLQIKESKTQQKTDASQKSLIEDKTSTSESTAHGAAPIEYAPAPTPRRHEPKVTPAEARTPKQISSKPAPKPTPIQAAPVLAPTALAASSPQIRTPVAFFDGDSTFSPTLTEHDQQRPTHFQSSTSTGRERSNEELLKKFKENIYQIQEDQSQQFSWIRKLSSQKWFTFFDTVLAGFTLLFFSTAFYLIFHINPTLEYKLTPEFQLKIRPFTVKDSFQRCNHSFWIRTDDSLAPFIDDKYCFRNYEDGSMFYDIYPTSTPNSSDVCNMDRIEFHKCYTKNQKNDSMNIFLGFKNVNFEDYICNGSYFESEGTTLYSLNPPVQKYAMLDDITMPNFMNQTVSSAAFFFQCPKCTVGNHIINDPEFYKNYVYEIYYLESAIPYQSIFCDDFLMTGNKRKCQIDGSRLIDENLEKFFSQLVFPFEIVEDEEFCV